MELSFQFHCQAGGFLAAYSFEMLTCCSVYKTNKVAALIGLKIPLCFEVSAVHFLRSHSL